jgi:hypothetical protein
MKSFLCHVLMLLLLMSLVQAHQTKKQGEVHQAHHPHRRTANILPKEKNVITTPICTSQALVDADISGNKFISRAEYVNLLLDLAPSDCSIIDKWLNEEPLQGTFAELSCLCHEFGGIDGENDCCLQAVGVPMLAAFAVPDSYYPEAYAKQACDMIDQVIAEECPSTATPQESTTSTKSPTTSAPAPSPTLTMGLSVTTFDTVVPSTMPSLSTTPGESFEQTDAGDPIEVVIEDGLVTTTGGDASKETSKPEQGETLLGDTEEEGLQILDDGTVEEDRPEEEAFIDDDDRDTSNDENGPGSMPTTSKETRVGIILAAMLVIFSVSTLVLLALWGRRHGLLQNPWKRSKEPTISTSTSDDHDDIETPRRSNARRSHSFSSSEGDSSMDEEHDPNFAQSASRKVRNSEVIRAEFQDDLSVWGRRKRRRQERKRRREERERALLEHNPPQHQSSITTILSTLDFDLGSGAPGGISGSLSRPTSTRSMASHRSGKQEDMVDIFDDQSETSSYDGLPQQHMGDIEEWLDQNVQGKSRINGDGSIVVDDRSVTSHQSLASKRSDASATPKGKSPSPKKQLRRQPNDPPLLDWHAKRQQLNTASAIRKIDYSKLTAPYDLTNSRSYSPQRLVQQSIAASTSFSPSQSPKPAYLLTSLAFSPAASPERHHVASTSHSVPGSPADKAVRLLETGIGRHVRTISESCLQLGCETKDSDSPLYSLKSVAVRNNNEIKNWKSLHLEMPVIQSNERRPPPPPRLSPDSQEFYDTVLKMEQSDEEDDDRRGNAFAFEAVRPRNAPAPERYLV